VNGAGGAGSARQEVLARVRAALDGTPDATRAAATAQVPRGYRTSGDLPSGAPELVDLLEDRLVDYKAVVRRCRPAGIADALAAALTEGLAAADESSLEGARVVVPPGLDRAWLAAAPVEVVTDGARDLDGTAGPWLDAAALDRVDGVVTAAAVAVAETGTIVLDASPDQGRRAITLVPDLHVCVVRADQVVATVPEAVARLDPVRPLTWISGPSATSDIELIRVEGVHGPRTLQVVLVQPDPVNEAD
jgi:L-lactate dehydrogenase complex protein LldG